MTSQYEVASVSLALLDQRRAEKQFRQTMQARFPAPKSTPEAIVSALKALEASLTRVNAGGKELCDQR